MELGLGSFHTGPPIYDDTEPLTSWHLAQKLTLLLRPLESTQTLVLKFTVKKEKKR